MLERRPGLNNALEARDNSGLRRLLLSRLVEATKIVAGLEDVVGDFLSSKASAKTSQEPRVHTYRAVRSCRLFVEDADKNLDRIRVLQDLEKRRVHRQMLNSLQHLREAFRLQQLACTQQSYDPVNTFPDSHQKATHS